MHSVFINLHFSDNSLQTNSSVNNVDSQIQNTIALEMFQMHFPTTYLALSAILDWLLSCHWSSKILAWLMDFVLIAWSQVTQILNRNPQILNRKPQIFLWHLNKCSQMHFLDIQPSQHSWSYCLWRAKIIAWLMNFALITHLQFFRRFKSPKKYLNFKGNHHIFANFSWTLSNVNNFIMKERNPYLSWIILTKERN